MRSYLWVIDLHFQSRHHNGGLVRYLNLSRELLVRGHRVVFAVCVEEDREQAFEWMASLVKSGVCTDYCELVLEGPGWNRFAALLAPLALHGLAIRRFRESLQAALRDISRRYSTDLLIVSSNRCIYAAHEFRECLRIGDFSDCRTLFWWREFALSLKHRRFREARGKLPNLVTCFFLELYTSRKYDANILVSPVDKKVFDMMARGSSRDRLLMNGVQSRLVGTDPVKNPKQIIFSGAMDFAPNYDGALWFLDNVFPLVVAKIPDVVFVVAGARPHGALAARAGRNVRVTGFVDDLNLLIAESALYVAPMKSGSGFKNKVAEAIANGTWVIGTTLSLEFLEPRLRDMMPAYDDPREMATAIAGYLTDPGSSHERLTRLREIVATEFSWAARAEELDRIVQSLPRIY